MNRFLKGHILGQILLQSAKLLYVRPFLGLFIGFFSFLFFFLIESEISEQASRQIAREEPNRFVNMPRAVIDVIIT